MKRRTFIHNSTLGLSAILSLRHWKSLAQPVAAENFKSMVENLLKDWCDGMLAHQINKPEDSTVHGALECQSCNTIHGRGMDAVYPFLYMAQKTGDKKYLNAGINALDWSKNVSTDDGAWTVMPDPTTWKGISVFGAIALAETLKFHGSILPADIHNRWTERLKKVAEYIFKTFDMTFTNINYGFSAVHALHLLGEALNEPKYTQRSHELGADIKNWLTEPNKLIFGEGKPSNAKSKKGLPAVDLGYNVEETINGAVQYALATKDTELITLLQQSLEGHLEFMLPDGAWDNSWGTREYKWSYWGSRTTDGCQPAYVGLAHLNPAFGKAAYMNTLLLKNCTANGLLHGGPHFVSAGVPPCIHHTFSHAKVLATLLNEPEHLAKIQNKGPLPREKNYGFKHLPEVDVSLVSHNDWIGTVSAYDFIYKKHAQPAAGGALGVLFHQKLGSIFTASMAKYMLVEAFNQQSIDGEDLCLTPRIETTIDGIWYTNIYDLTATTAMTKNGKDIVIKAQVSLVNEDQETPQSGSLHFEIEYTFGTNFKISIKPKTKLNSSANIQIVLPLVSQNTEKTKAISNQIFEIQKPGGKLKIQTNQPYFIKKTPKNRVFNLVPGVEAIPFIVNLNPDKPFNCTLSIS